MRVFDGEGKNLGSEEDKGGNSKAPKTRCVEDFNEKIGSDATGESTDKAADGEDRNMHCLPLHDEVFGSGVIVVSPKGSGIIANIAAVKLV